MERSSVFVTGYALSTGRLFRDPRLYYVVGAPGSSSGKGKVSTFSCQKNICFVLAIYVSSKQVSEKSIGIFV